MSKKLGKKNNIPHYSDSSKIYNRTIIDTVSKTKNIPHNSDSSNIYNRTIVDRVSKTKNIPHYCDSSKIYNRTIVDTVSTTNKQILIWRISSIETLQVHSKDFKQIITFFFLFNQTKLKTNSCRQNTTQITRDCKTWTSLKSWGELGCDTVTHIFLK